METADRPRREEMSVEPDPVKLFIAVLYSQTFTAYEELEQVIHREFGLIDARSKLTSFEGSTYYEPEMGPGLIRGFWSFERLVSPGSLAEAKIRTLAIEKQFARDGNRLVNLDPGYLDYNKVVLASTKFGGQKIYLAQGIYADLTLFFFKAKFQSFAWSFPDFRDGYYDDFLASMREKYKLQRRSELANRLPDMQGEETRHERT